MIKAYQLYICSCFQDLPSVLSPSLRELPLILNKALPTLQQFTTSSTSHSYYYLIAFFKHSTHIPPQ